MQFSQNWSYIIKGRKEKNRDEAHKNRGVYDSIGSHCVCRDPFVQNWIRKDVRGKQTAGQLRNCQRKSSEVDGDVFSKNLHVKLKEVISLASKKNQGGSALKMILGWVVAVILLGFGIWFSYTMKEQGKAKLMPPPTTPATVTK